MKRGFAWWALGVASLLHAIPGGTAEAEFVGPDACRQCHQAEYEVWENSQHFASFRELPRHPDVAGYLDAIDGERNIRRDPTCSTCHFTQVSVRGRDPRPVAGPSCESCHGAASEWIDVHNDYGGAGVTAANETVERKRERHGRAMDAGMIWSFMHYDIAANCMECHGLANPRVDADTLAQLKASGHPVKLDFELVRFSQGTVRHRFYPPDVTVNAEMPPEGLARLYLLGQAAQFASASGAAAGAGPGAYREIQVQRRDSARRALQSFADIAEVEVFLGEPSAEHGRKLADALQKLDLTGRVADLLPDPETYK